jgi:hypothetical protein
MPTQGMPWERTSLELFHAVAQQNTTLHRQKKELSSFM